MNDHPTDTVLKAFHLLHQEILPLARGTDRCWCGGHTVLKPWEDPVEWRWRAEHQPGVKQEEFRLPVPNAFLAGAAFDGRQVGFQSALLTLAPATQRPSSAALFIPTAVRVAWGAIWTRHLKC